MKYIRSERGNTLIIVLLMIVIFTVAGLSLVTTTFNGVKKTDARETQIQSIELAEKGIDYLTTLLETKSLEYENYTVEEFKNEMDSLLAPYEVDHADSDFLFGSNVTTTKVGDEIKVKIYDREYTTNNTNDVSQIMTLHSEATVKGKTKTLITTIKLGAKPVPEALNYALGSYNPFPCKDCNEETDAGNMFLHGAVNIKGDVYVEGNLITRDKAYALFGWPNSDFPSIEGNSEKKANLVLRGKLYQMLTNRSYSTHINETDFTNTNYYKEIKKENIESAFTRYTAFKREFVPTMVDRTPNFKPINITAEKNNYYFTNTVNTFPPVITATQNCTFTTIGVTKGNSKSCTNSWNTGNLYAYNDLDSYSVLNHDFSFNRLSYISKNNIGILIDGKDSDTTNISFKEGAYIKGNLIIGNQGRNEGKDKIEIDGPIYVDGDLTISGADVKFNSTIYVTGATSVSNSLLQGKGPVNNERTVVLFGKKPINFILNNIYEEEPMTIKGFFYSEDLIEMYGVISNLKIQGGVFGRKVVFNAIKNSSSPDTSRLSIIYDPDLIKNPPDGLPVVKELTITKLNRQLK